MGNKKESFSVMGKVAPTDKYNDEDIRYCTEFARKHNVTWDGIIKVCWKDLCVTMASYIATFDDIRFDIDNNINIGYWEDYESWLNNNSIYRSFREWFGEVYVVASNLDDRLLELKNGHCGDDYPIHQIYNKPSDGTMNNVYSFISFCKDNGFDRLISLRDTNISFENSIEIIFINVFDGNELLLSVAIYEALIEAYVESNYYTVYEDNFNIEYNDNGEIVVPAEIIEWLNKLVDFSKGTIHNDIGKMQFLA